MVNRILPEWVVSVSNHIGTFGYVSMQSIRSEIDKWKACLMTTQWYQMLPLLVHKLDAYSVVPPDWNVDMVVGLNESCISQMYHNKRHIFWVQQNRYFFDRNIR